MQTPPPPIAFPYDCDFAIFVRSHPDLESFVRSQPEFISQYYHHFKFFPVAFSLYEQLANQETIAIATNGGAIPSKGSIGFVIAKLHDGESFLRCYGQPAVINPQSF